MWALHPRRGLCVSSPATVAFPFAAVVGARGVAVSLLFLPIIAGVKGWWGAGPWRGQLLPFAPRRRRVPSVAPRGGKPSPGMAAGFYSPENESQRWPCLSGERGHCLGNRSLGATASENGKETRQGWERGRGKACWPRARSPYRSTRWRLPSCKSGVGPQRFGGISVQVEPSDPPESQAWSTASTWGRSGLREPRR